MTGGQGYRSAAYKAALSALGEVQPLGDTGGWLISRAIGDSGLRDLMGPYPVLCCTDWGALGAALSNLAPGHVALTCVTDPFCPLSKGELEQHFSHVRPLHQHYIIDLAAPVLSKHHRKKLRRSGELRIEMRAPRPGDLPAWSALYAGLAARHGIHDMRRFDDASFAQQLAVPDAQFVLAYDGDTLIGADLYYVDGDVAYAHLSAYAEAGYVRSVSYPMMAFAIEALKGRVCYIDLGGAPMSAGDGMTHFKRGWTDQMRLSYLCGRVLDAAAFDKLSPEGVTDYFPPYRRGEFARS